MKSIEKFKAGLCAIAGLGLLFPAPVAAADVLTLEPASAWKATKWPDKCRLTRHYGSEGMAMRLTIEKGGTEPTFNLLLTGDAVRSPQGTLISVQFGPREEAYGRNYIAVKTRSGDSAIVMYGASFSVTIPKGEGGYQVERLEGERLAAIEYLQIERAGLNPFRMPTGDLTKSMETLRKCTQSLEGALAVSKSGVSQQATPASNPGRWVLSQDYPPMMLSYEQEGVVTYRLTVGKHGRPTFCNIERSTTPQMFDDAVCLALLRRAQFKPALDWDGNPTASYWYGSVRFQIR